MKPADPSPWSAYVPTKDDPWTLRRVVQMHRRAGFAATWGELQRDLADGPEKSVQRLLDGKARTQGIPEEFDSFSATLAENADEPGRLKAWWVYRMLFGPDGLGERLTLTWHNHFATSLEKVRSRGTMRRQNEALREHSKVPFAKLLDAVMRDPAILVWLDASSNTKGAANENLARELMELFTLGVGHYSEKDVKEAARALTGWTVVEDRFRMDDLKHDTGDKVILGQKGKWKMPDVLRFLVAHPATADRLAFRLCEQFVGEGEIDRKQLADGLRKHNLDVARGVETVLRSRVFFSDANSGRRVVGPVEFVVGTARALELFDPPPSTMLLADWAARLGQDLFYPPNVGGWKGGRHWLSAQTMIGRANFATALVNGKLSHQATPMDALGLAKKHDRGDTLEGVVSFYADLLLGGPPSSRWLERLQSALGTNPALSPDLARRIVILILSSPEAQLS